MFWYWFIFVWIALMAVLSAEGHFRRAELSTDGRIRWRWIVFAAFLAFWPIYYLAVFDTPRWDTYAYLNAFQKLPDTWEGLAEVMSAGGKDKGFTAFGILVKMLSGNDPQFYRIVIGLLQTIPIVLIYRKYSRNYILSLYLFTAASCHLTGMMNAVRQFIAATIIFAATPLLEQKKYGRLALVILFASLFHRSALIMLPVIFVVQGKAWNKRTLLCIAGAVCVAVVFGRNTALFDQLMGAASYDMEELRILGDDGEHPLRVVIAMVPVLIAFVGRKRLAWEKEPITDICINMAMVNVCIHLVAMVTSGVLIGRLPIYTNMYNYILLPNIIDRIFTKESAKVLTALMVVFYFLYYLSGA